MYDIRIAPSSSLEQEKCVQTEQGNISPQQKTVLHSNSPDSSSVLKQILNISSPSNTSKVQRTKITLLNLNIQIHPNNPKNGTTNNVQQKSQNLTLRCISKDFVEKFIHDLSKSTTMLSKSDVQTVFTSTPKLVCKTLVPTNNNDLDYLDMTTKQLKKMQMILLNRSSEKESTNANSLVTKEQTSSLDWRKRQTQEDIEEPMEQDTKVSVNMLRQYFILSSKS
ncbi:unnamed protein product [Didymodactylos carnosus]|uniref:Uncharacterized protein n=1 Tax=Didymodactylos carnosus TaxID=1234261 RepID=A0A813YM39_9BILA|nr:unnamed protein product [Didymodactylos carnosus]CAF3671461.1 unnamed protein product [Didymodactylos carnosus]